MKYDIEEIFPPMTNPFDVVEYDDDGMFVASWRFSTLDAAERFQDDLKKAWPNGTAAMTGGMENESTHSS